MFGFLSFSFLDPPLDSFFSFLLRVKNKNYVPLPYLLFLSTRGKLRKTEKQKMLEIIAERSGNVGDLIKFRRKRN